MPNYNIATQELPDPTIGARQRGAFNFIVSGQIAVAVGIGLQESCCPFKITHVVVRRRKAGGTGGQTKIDILMDGVSIWEDDPDDRPVILQSGGDNQRIVAVTPVLLNLAADTSLSMSVLEIETGTAPEGLSVQAFGYRL